VGTAIVNRFDPPAAYVVRHGETDLNAKNCFRGWENPPLNEAGLIAAEAIANFFSYERIGRVVCSDLDRAQQTAEFIMNTGVMACPYLSPDFNLRPWNIAAFASREKSAALQKELDYYIENPEVKIPDGESLKDFQDRQESLIHYLVTPFEGLPTIVVTHTSNLTYLAEAIDRDNGLDPSRDPEVHDVVEPGGIVAVFLDTNGKMRLEPRLGAVEAEKEPQAS
jgi:broad specificity phosphatase PhoE